MIGRAWRVGVAVLAAGVALAGGGCREKGKTPLLVHVGGTMRPVITELAKAYTARTGQPVEINAADSGQLLAHIEGHEKGDLYVCHDPFLARLMNKGLGADGWQVAALTPVIVLRKGNPRNAQIHGLADLMKPDVSVVLTEPEYSTLGHLLPTMFAKARLDWEAVKKKAKFVREGGQAANEVKLGNRDAAIVWNAVAWLRRDALDAVVIPDRELPTPGVDAVTSATRRVYVLRPVYVTIATLKCSKQQAAAKAFAEFIGSETAAKAFAAQGFDNVPTAQSYAAGKLVAPAPATAPATQP